MLPEQKDVGKAEVTITYRGLLNEPNSYRDVENSLLTKKNYFNGYFYPDLLLLTFDVIKVAKFCHAEKVVSDYLELSKNRGGYIINLTEEQKQFIPLQMVVDISVKYSQYMKEVPQY